MNSLNFDDQDGVHRSIREAPPTHYTLKIESLSKLKENSLEKYESGEFEAGGHKWRLVFYPNGNEGKNVTDHISLYLVMAGADTSRIHSGVHAVFRLFLLDQNTGNYFVFQEEKERRFHAQKLEWGFDQFLSTKAFTEASNGFLIDDTCVLGAEVFVSKETSMNKGECLLMVKDPAMYKHVWKIDNFSKIVTDCLDSNTFISGNHDWKIKLYPKGKGSVSTHMSLMLELADATSLPSDTKVYAEFTLRILNQMHPNFPSLHIQSKGSFWFSGSKEESGWHKFIQLSSVNRNIGYVFKDSCHVEAEVTVHGISTAI